MRAWKAFGQWVNTIRKASPKSTIPEHALYAARKLVKEGGGRFEFSRAQVSSIAFFLFKRECVGAHCHMLSERVRRLSERALLKGLEFSRGATHKWPSQALKGGAGPARRWCGKEGALPELPLVITDTNSFHALRDNMSQELVCGPAISIHGLRMFAKLVSLSRPKRPSVSTSTRSQTSHSSPDNALESLGEIIRQCFVKLAIPTQSHLQMIFSGTCGKFMTP